MTRPYVKGWCPGARRPMRSGDGLVVRMRPALGRLKTDQLRGLADLAERFGTGEIEVTNRANLQLRGVEMDEHPVLLSGLADLDLLPGSMESEGRLNIVLDPFHSGPSSPAIEIARGLAQALNNAEFASLPSKFGFVIDPGAPRHLSGVSGDVRVEEARNAAGLIVRADGMEDGRAVRDIDAAIASALDMARWFLASSGVGADGRGRMARHIADVALPPNLRGDAPPCDPAPWPQPGAASDGTLVAAAFGVFSAEALRAIGRVCPDEVRVTPWRMLFLPGAAPTALPAHQGLIVAPADPLWRVQACTGADGCAQAHVETRRLARALAPDLAEGIHAHVSGCAKGCAWPRSAEVTLVGTTAGFDLVRNGAPWDVPERLGLTPAEALSVFKR